MHVYLPMWLHIRKKPNWTEGPRHIQRLLNFSREMNSQLHLIVCKKIVNNSYFMHSENLLLAMITDPDSDIRAKAYDKIISIRQKANLSNGNRIFIKPTTNQFNNESQHYSTLIDWDNFPDSITEPPFTLPLTIEDLNYYKTSDEIIEVPAIPCHSQRTEACIQVVSDAVKRVAGTERQIAEVKSILSSRENMPSFKNKRDFKC